MATDDPDKLIERVDVLIGDLRAVLRQTATATRIHGDRDAVVRGLHERLGTEYSAQAAESLFDELEECGLLERDGDTYTVRDAAYQTDWIEMVVDRDGRLE
jgi:hypothetical protein